MNVTPGGTKVSGRFEAAVYVTDEDVLHPEESRTLGSQSELGREIFACR